MANNQCDRVNRCKNSWWCADDYDPANKDCFEPMTHGDKLRAKSDRGLAAWAHRIETEGRAFGPRGFAYWLNWLRREAKDA